MTLTAEHAARLEAFARKVARLETWEERCEAEAREDGLTDPAEIAAHVASAQSDTDYLIGRDETLENLIRTARMTLAEGEPT